MEEIEKLAGKIKENKCLSEKCEFEKKVLDEMLKTYNLNSYKEATHGQTHVYCVLDNNLKIKCYFETKRMF